MPAEPSDRDADSIIERLGMQPHPEGGHYVETWRGPQGDDGRALGTTIHYLLRAGEVSHWHRVDADEVWLFHAGAPLRLSIIDADRSPPDRYVLGDPLDGNALQLVVPAGAWQSAESRGAWTLVSCVVIPGFEFDGFELAPPNWSP